MAVLLEGPLVQKLQAEGTGEVFGVPLASHGCHTLAWMYRRRNHNTFQIEHPTQGFQIEHPT